MIAQIFTTMTIQSVAFLFFAWALGFSAGSRSEGGVRAVGSLALTTFVMFLFGWMTAFFVAQSAGTKNTAKSAVTQADGEFLFTWTALIVGMFLVGVVLGLVRRARALKAGKYAA